MDPGDTPPKTARAWSATDDPSAPVLLPCPAAPVEEFDGADPNVNPEVGVIGTLDGWDALKANASDAWLDAPEGVGICAVSVPPCGLNGLQFMGEYAGRPLLGVGCVAAAGA